ncbi:MAG TPA: ABC transporter ATP-binding protein, partial [Verrucomicrobiae bacterium]|nr:ABC transporter ATP-binding protein [Verrucomicrobiae bacterium]
ELTMMIELTDVYKSYGAVRALDGLSLRVERDEIVALLGPNGAGKTTALEIALGLRCAESGSVRLFGGSPRDAETRRRVGATPQESGFPDNLRVSELLDFAASHYPHPAAPGAILGTFGLEALASRRAGQLSGGESRRLALALAFVGNPDLAVLDEPTTGLDVESRRRLWDVVRDAARERSILFTTHYLEEAEALATRIVVVDRGRAIFDGGARELRERFGARRVSYVGAPFDPSAYGVDATHVASNGRVVAAAADADAYVRALVRSGAAFSQLEVASPSLEEAFLSITGGSK